MRKMIMLVLYIALGNVFAEKYSIFNDWLLDPTDQAHLNTVLDAAETKGFNTIAITICPDIYEPGNYLQNEGILGTSIAGSSKLRNDYLSVYNTILGHSGDFNLIIRISFGAATISNADPNKVLSWDNADYFLKHDDGDLSTECLDLYKKENPNTIAAEDINVFGSHGGKINESWDNDIDYCLEGGHRSRVLNFSHPDVNDIIKRSFELIVNDVVDIAKSKGKVDKIVSFVPLLTAFQESEYPYNILMGNNVQGEFDSRLKSWGTEAQVFALETRLGILKNLFTELSSFVTDHRNNSGGAKYSFGIFPSSAYIGDVFIRGSHDLFTLTEGMNPGDWIYAANLFHGIWNGAIRNDISTDFYTSLAEVRGLRFGDELSWPDFPCSPENSPHTKLEHAEKAYQTQVDLAYKHGAEAMFVTNWSIRNNNGAIEFGNGDSCDDKWYHFDNLILDITTFFSTDDEFTPKRNKAVIYEPWSLFSMINSDFQVPAYSFVVQPNYLRISDQGNTPVSFVSSSMLDNDISVLEKFEEITLSIPTYSDIHKGTTAALKRRRNKLLHAQELAWVDPNNLYTGDVSPDYAGIHVSLSDGVSFGVADLWSAWGGNNNDIFDLTDSKGYFVGDFDGNGFDDIMQFKESNHKMLVVLSTGLDGFKSLNNSSVSIDSSWGGWGATGKDILVGDFNGDGSDDLLWVDHQNSTPTNRGLKVVPSLKHHFGMEQLASVWGGSGTDEVSLEDTKGWFVGDFNGDGLDDFMNFKESTHEFQVILASSSDGTISFSAVQNWGSWGAIGGDVRIGDFNGDGSDDLLWVDHQNNTPHDHPTVQVVLSNGLDHFGYAQVWSVWGGQNNDMYDISDSRGYYVGDFNGDGFDDFMNLKNSDNKLQVILSRETYFESLLNSSKRGDGTWGAWGATGRNVLVGNFGVWTPKSVNPHTLGKTYHAGQLVSGRGKSLYECKPWPYEGWCGLRQPEATYGWEEAWTKVQEAGDSANIISGTLESWINGKVYSGFDQVEHKGRNFECKGWPYSGWCGQREPGIGLGWEEAWFELEGCPQ